MLSHLVFLADYCIAQFETPCYTAGRVSKDNHDHRQRKSENQKQGRR
jgi:hypothetical protein